MLASNLQIQRLALLDDGTSHAGDFNIGSIFINLGSIICALKHNTCMISLY